MKKTVFLRDENYKRKQFEYEGDIAEALKKELAARKISIGDGASIGNDASIGEDASIGYRASIGNDVKMITGLYITGTKHPVTYTGNGTISIGCHNKTISFWMKMFKEIGKKEGYSPEQIAEYGGYIKAIKSLYGHEEPTGKPKKNEKK